MNKVNKKILVVLMLALTLFSSTYNIVFASTEINSASLFKVQEWEPHLQYWNADKNMWYYVTTNYIGYNYNGRVLPAYCMNKDLPRNR